MNEKDKCGVRTTAPVLFICPEPKERKMKESQETTAALDEAAAEAGEETAEETDEKPAFTAVETEEETVTEEEIPQDHGERSNLGRKISAVHRRIDETDQKFNRIMEFLEKQKDPLDELSPDEPITRKEAEEILESRERQKQKTEEKYNTDYTRAVANQGADLDAAEYDAILAEFKNITYTPSGDPVRDAELNFLKAERIYLRKKGANPVRENPLKGKGAEKAGLATSQKTVSKTTAEPKLDKHAKAYLDHVRGRDGDEAAQKLVKDVG